MLRWKKTSAWRGLFGIGIRCSSSSDVGFSPNMGISLAPTPVIQMQMSRHDWCYSSCRRQLTILPLRVFDEFKGQRFTCCLSLSGEDG
ncbi:hypothetical protein EDB84DRAFT_1449825 [Lactarius hengduanensis]|nr:hypothetical protein EDB84DRAFT_1449825 [Lactarius hengduanensis]